MNAWVWIPVSVLLGLVLGLAAAFLWLQHSPASPLKKIQGFLSPQEAKRLHNEIENLEDQLQQAWQDLYQVSSHPGSIVLVTDDLEQIQYASPAVVSLTAFNHDQLAAMHLVELFSPESRPILTQALDKIGKNHLHPPGDWLEIPERLALVRQNGETAWVITRIKLETDESLDKKIICQLSEVTQMVIQEDRFEQQRQALRQQINTLSEANQQTDLLNRSLTTLLPSLDPEYTQKALNLCAAQLHTAVGCSGVFATQLSDIQMVVIAQSGFADTVLNQSFPLDETNPLADVLLSQQAVTVNLGATPFTGALSHLNRFSHCLSIPLGRGEALLGALALFDDAPGAFKPHQIRTVQLYANLFELILRTSRLSDRLSQLRANDQLTGLPNRSTILEIGKREVERTRRYARPLCLILLDIDGFGAINNQYGELAGDQILQNVARLLRSGLREADLVARTGADEFVVILPETPITHFNLEPKPGKLAAGLSAAERIRQLLSTTPIDTVAGTLHISACFGIAGVDSQCHDFLELLLRSETALQLARHFGQNQIEAWQSGADRL